MEEFVVSGESMSPLLQDGQIIQGKKIYQRNFNTSDILIAKYTNGSLIIKFFHDKKQQSVVLRDMQNKLFFVNEKDILYKVIEV